MNAITRRHMLLVLLHWMVRYDARRCIRDHASHTARRSHHAHDAQMVHELGESAHRVCSNATGKNKFLDPLSHAVQRKLYIRTAGPTEFKKHGSRGRAARRRNQYFLYVVHAQRRGR